MVEVRIGGFLLSLLLYEMYCLCDRIVGFLLLFRCECCVGYFGNLSGLFELNLRIRRIVLNSIVSFGAGRIFFSGPNCFFFFEISVSLFRN